MSRIEKTSETILISTIQEMVKLDKKALTKIKKLEERIASLQELHKEMLQDHKYYESQLEKIQNLESRQSAIVTLEEMNKSYRIQVEDLVKQVEDRDISIDKLEQEVSYLRDKLDAAKKDLEKSHSTISHLQDDLD